MKSTSDKDPDVRDEYDFRGADVVIGKYAARYAEGTNVILLDPDVAKIFHDSESVNRALRALGEIAQRVEKPRSRRAAKRSGNID